MNDDLICFVKDFFDLEPKEMRFSKVVEICRTDKKLKFSTEQCRLYKARSTDESLSGAQIMEAIRLADKYKKDHPAVIPSVKLNGGKKREHIVALNSWFGIDFDHVGAEKRDEIMTKLKQDPHTSFCSPSISNDGIRGFVLITNKSLVQLQTIWDSASANAKSKVFLYVWHQIADYYEQLSGEKLDQKCANPEHSFSIAYDPDAYYNPDAEPFEIDMSGFELPKPGRKKSNSKAAAKGKAGGEWDKVIAKILSRLELEGQKPEDGRNDYLYRFATYCNKYGVDQEVTLQWAHDNMLEDDFDINEITSTVNGVYQHTDQFGTFMADEANNIDWINDSLHTLAEFRYNAIKRRIEVRFTGELETLGSEWTLIDDRIFNTLYTHVKRCVKKASNNDVNAVLSSLDFCEEYHPMRAYIESCAKWQPGQKDFIRELFDHLLLADGANVERLYHYFRKWFIRFVALCLGITDDNQLVLALVGAENTGKTFFTKKILPPELSEYYQRIDPHDKLDKDLQICLSEKYIVNFDERRIDKRNTDSFKSLISGGSKSVRRPYGRYSENIRQYASMVLTSNEVRYIAESDGNRRYLSLHIAGTRNFNEFPIDYEGLYAQAMYLIDNGELTTSLTQDETAEIKEMNREFTEIDACEDAISTYFEVPGPGSTDSEWLSATLVLATIGSRIGSEEMTVTRIGTTMGKMGFSKKKRHGCFVYAVVRRVSPMIPDGDYDYVD